MIKESAQVLETKGKIRDAFFNLYAKKAVGKITIKELTEMAGINRGTFYVHYLDIYDLLEKVEEEVLGLFEDTIKPVLEKLLKGEPFGENLPTPDFFVKNNLYMDFVFGEKGNPAMIKALKETAKKLAAEGFGGLDAMPKSSNYVLEYIASAQVALVTYWYQRNFEIPISEFSELVKFINYNGAISYLEKGALPCHEGPKGV